MVTRAIESDPKVLCSMNLSPCFLWREERVIKFLREVKKKVESV